MSDTNSYNMQLSPSNRTFFSSEPKPKPCKYGCGIMIIWDKIENQYVDNNTRKKHNCPKFDTGSNPNPTNNNTPPPPQQQNTIVSRPPAFHQSSSPPQEYQPTTTQQQQQQNEILEQLRAINNKLDLLTLITASLNSICESLKTKQHHQKDEIYDISVPPLDKDDYVGCSDDDNDNGDILKD